MATYYNWMCTQVYGNGRRRRYKLAWSMTEADASRWQEHKDNAGKTLEMVPGSGKERGERARPYLGWGQALPHDRRSHGSE